MASLTLQEFGKRMIAILPRLMREISRYESHYISEGTITPPQLLVLDHLSSKGPCPMSALAEVMNLHCSSATGLVDRLVRESLVERSHGEQDRRVVTVSITPKGKNALKHIYQQKQKGVIELFSRLSTKERAVYIEILEKLSKDLAVRKKTNE